MKHQSIALLPVIEQIARIGCYETDIATGIWTGSDNFIALFGLDKKETYQVEEFQALVHPDDFEWVMAYFAECLDKRIDFNCEYRCLKKNGETIYVNSRSKIYYRPDGTPERILGIKQDITQFHQKERRLNQLNENNKKKNEVLGIVAHDLKSPLSQLQGLARLMKLELEPKHHQMISLQESICHSAHKIIMEIVEIAELEDEAYQLKTALEDINLHIEQAIKNFTPNANEKGITIQTKFFKECNGFVNAQKFSRVINNLLSNAIKFSPENKTIELCTYYEEEKFVVTVKDEGIGIKKENLPFVFDRFSTTVRRPGTKGEQSTGLGLSIVKQICALHHGEITVESQVNNGTTFRLAFPKVQK